jgi:hypothetical protein
MAGASLFAMGGDENKGSAAGAAPEDRLKPVLPLKQAKAQFLSGIAAEIF